MGVTLRVRPGDGGTIVAVSGEVDVCTEAPPQQALLRIIRERSARLMLDLSGVSFMDCAGLRALRRPRRAELRGGCMRRRPRGDAVRAGVALALAGRAMDAVHDRSPDGGPRIPASPRTCVRPGRATALAR